MNKKLIIIIVMIVNLFNISVACASSIQFKIRGINGAMEINVIEKLNEALNHTRFDLWYTQSKDYIREAMAPFGYFNPEVKSYIVNNNKTKNIYFKIKKGKAVNVTAINIHIIGEGKFDSQLNTFIKTNEKSLEGKLKTNEYERFKKDVLEIANNAGYIKSFWKESNIIVDSHAHTAIINLTLETKQKYYFSTPIFYQRKPVYSHKFLNRFAISAPTGYFSSKKLIEYQQKLSTSQYFREVTVTPNLDTSSTQIPIKVDTVAPPAKKYTLGIGYSTWSGPRFLGGVAFRQLNDEGHYIETQVKLSPIISGASAKYYIPGHDPMTQHWIFGANIQRFLPKSGSSTSSTLLAAYDIKKDGWHSNLALNYLLEQYKIQTQHPETTAFIYPSLILSHASFDDPIYPVNAHNVSLTLRGASRNALSSTSFFQGLITSKYLFSIKEGTKLIGKVDFGYTVVEDITNLPLSLRFFTGGANSIRGYKDSSIGPGKYLMLGSLELQQHIYGSWEAAIFYDQGKAANHFNAPWSKSAGVGAIYASIVGPLKLYLARDISSPGKPYRIEFSFGPEF